ncbi:MAG: peroxiredoxin [Gammaproteobacteria bacterium]
MVSRLAFPLAATALALAMAVAERAAAADPQAAAPAAPSVGAPAPKFKLQDQTRKWVSLDDHKGKWVVLYFYPKDNTPGCTTQACEFRDNIFAFRDANAVILGVSVDDVASHGEFAKEHRLPFPILADPTKQVAKEYGVLRSLGVMEVARRETFIIDPKGRIAKRYPSVDPKGHSQLVLNDLKELKAPHPDPLPAARGEGAGGG